MAAENAVEFASAVAAAGDSAQPGPAAAAAAGETAERSAWRRSHRSWAAAPVSAAAAAVLAAAVPKEMWTLTDGPAASSWTNSSVTARFLPSVRQDGQATPFIVTAVGSCHHL